MKPSTKFWITEPLTVNMAFYIALVTWSSVYILTQGSTMRARYSAELERIFSYPKTTPRPEWNGPVLTLAKFIKIFMSSASEAELGAMFITAQ